MRFRLRVRTGVFSAYSAAISTLKPVDTTMNSKFFYLGELILMTFLLFGF
jgi:hypothetical protein